MGAFHEGRRALPEGLALIRPTSVSSTQLGEGDGSPLPDVIVEDVTQGCAAVGSMTILCPQRQRSSRPGELVCGSVSVVEDVAPDLISIWGDEDDVPSDNVTVGQVNGRWWPVVEDGAQHLVSTQEDEILYPPG